MNAENKSEHVRTGENTEKGTARGQQNVCPPAGKPRRLSTTNLNHWLPRLRKRSFKDRQTGQCVEIPDWQIRLKKDGEESWFNLGTPNQASAAAKAKEISAFLEANGWDATKAKYKAPATTTPRVALTIGDFIQAVQGTGQLRPRTFLNYQNCLRTLASEVFGVNGGKAKFDYKTGGNQQWIGRIDRIRLDRLTPERVSRWQQARIRKAGNSPVVIASAKRTCNSYVRCARSLFNKELLKRLNGAGVQLPAKLPFEGVELFEQGSMKYVSKVNAQSLIAAARAELKEQEPEAYKVFLLGLFGGLRKGEIDGLSWGMLDWQTHVIRLEETEWLHLKTHDSAGEIAIDPEVSAELQAMMTASKSKFVISSDRSPRNDSARAYYRCEPVFDKLTAWLRGKGVKANKPLHEMRKEVGALIATQQGIFAASRFLRHSDITTTARHYVEHKGRITSGLKLTAPEPDKSKAAS